MLERIRESMLFSTCCDIWFHSISFPLRFPVQRTPCCNFCTFPRQRGSLVFFRFLTMDKRCFSASFCETCAFSLCIVLFCTLLLIFFLFLPYHTFPSLPALSCSRTACFSLQTCHHVQKNQLRYRTYFFIQRKHLLQTKSLIFDASLNTRLRHLEDIFQFIRCCTRNKSFETRIFTPLALFSIVFKLQMLFVFVFHVLELWCLDRVLIHVVVFVTRSAHVWSVLAGKLNVHVKEILVFSCCEKLLRILANFHHSVRVFAMLIDFSFCQIVQLQKIPACDCLLFFHCLQAIPLGFSVLRLTSTCAAEQSPLHFENTHETPP